MYTFLVFIPPVDINEFSYAILNSAHDANLSLILYENWIHLRHMIFPPHPSRNQLSYRASQKKSPIKFFEKLVSRSFDSWHQSTCALPLQWPSIRTSTPPLELLEGEKYSWVTRKYFKKYRFDSSHQSTCTAPPWWPSVRATSGVTPHSLLDRAVQWRWGIEGGIKGVCAGAWFMCEAYPVENVGQHSVHQLPFPPCLLSISSKLWEWEWCVSKVSLTSSSRVIKPR